MNVYKVEMRSIPWASGHELTVTNIHAPDTKTAIGHVQRMLNQPGQWKVVRLTDQGGNVLEPVGDIPQ
jgi:hypothetical protein